MNPLTQRRIAITMGLLLLSATAPAQTTPTERDAAGDVLRQIEALQARLRTAEAGRRLVARPDVVRDQLLARTEHVWSGTMQGLSDYIGHHPEVGWQEFRSVDTLLKVLRHHGFVVDTNVAGLKTAFVARWVSPAGGHGPVLGLIGEYDALRSTKEPFHGDQHNAQTPVAIAAAVSLQEYMIAHKVPGSIRLFGTPAEEVGPPAKSIMRDSGVFRGTDILIRSHSSTSTARARAGFGICCLNINEVKYTFTGRPSHQLTAWNGRNALTAAVEFYTAVDHLRPSFRPEASIQGVIPEGGAAPNVVPERAVVDYYVRYPDGVYLAHIQEMMDAAAKAAAMATGTTVTINRYGEYRDGVTVGTLEEAWFAYAKQLGATEVNAEPQRPAGFEETGGVSLDIPGVGVTAFSSRGSYHTYEMLADAFTDVGHTAFRIDAQVMAAVLYHFLTDAPFRDAVKEEHRALAALFAQYQSNLTKAYAPELATVVP